MFTGSILQSKLVLAQRMPILQAGLRQMVLEATHLAMDEQNAILNKQRAVVDAGPESPSQAIVTRAAFALTYLGIIAPPRTRSSDRRPGERA